MPTKYTIVDKLTKEVLTIPGVILTWKTEPKKVQAVAIVNALCPDKYELIKTTISDRESVLAYIDSSKVRNKGSLIFKPEAPTKKEMDELKTLDKKVIKILQFGLRNNSYIENHPEYYETSRGRLRSSLDIWRHLLHFYPDISIFDVMHSICKLIKEAKVGASYCPTVHRRVFSYYTTERYSWHPQFYGFGNVKDEYDLTLGMWENI